TEVSIHFEGALDNEELWQLTLKLVSGVYGIDLKQRIEAPACDGIENVKFEGKISIGENIVLMTVPLDSDQLDMSDTPEYENIDFDRKLHRNFELNWLPIKIQFADISSSERLKILSVFENLNSDSQDITKSSDITKLETSGLLSL